MLDGAFGFFPFPFVERFYGPIVHANKLFHRILVLYESHSHNFH